MLQIAWISTTSDNEGDTADVTIWDAIEHRIEVFHADTGIQTTANHGDIIDRATQLLRDGGYLVVSALVPYKRIEQAILACSRLGKPLTIIGEGPERPRLERLAGSSVAFLGWQAVGKLGLALDAE